MIVLMLSADECAALAKGTPDRALVAYLQREAQMEQLLPDDNLPNAVLLRGLELDASQRHYVATIRTYATCAEADDAWAALGLEAVSMTEAPQSDDLPLLQALR